MRALLALPVVLALSGAARADEVAARDARPVSVSMEVRAAESAAGVGPRFQLNLTSWLAVDAGVRTMLFVSSVDAGVTLFAAEDAVAPYGYLRGGMTRVQHLCRVACDGTEPPPADVRAIASAGVGLENVYPSGFTFTLEAGVVHERAADGGETHAEVAAGIGYRF